MSTNSSLPPVEGFRLRGLDMKLPNPAAGPLVVTSWGSVIKRADCDALSREVRAAHETTGRKIHGIAFIERDYNPPPEELKMYMDRQWPEMASHVQSLHLCFAYFDVEFLDGIASIARLAATKIKDLNLFRSTRWMTRVADLVTQGTKDVGADNIHVHGSVKPMVKQVARRNVGPFAPETAVLSYAQSIYQELLAKGFKFPPLPADAWK